jgi:hypothetical protein
MISRAALATIVSMWRGGTAVRTISAAIQEFDAANSIGGVAPPRAPMIALSIPAFAHRPLATGPVFLVSLRVAMWAAVVAVRRAITLASVLLPNRWSSRTGRVVAVGLTLALPVTVE